jgi:hypothetical protein
MPFGFPFRINKSRALTGLPFASGVKGPTPTDESGQGKGRLRASPLFSKSAIVAR